MDLPSSVPRYPPQAQSALRIHRFLHSQIPRAACIHCIVSFHVRDLSICGFWYPQDSWYQPPMDTEGGPCALQQRGSLRSAVILTEASPFSWAGHQDYGLGGCPSACYWGTLPKEWPPRKNPYLVCVGTHQCWNLGMLNLSLNDQEPGTAPDGRQTSAQMEEGNRPADVRGTAGLWLASSSLLAHVEFAWFNETCVYSMAGEGNGTPLQYSCLENPMDGGAW